MLDGIEKVGNKLPHPVMLFALFAVLVIVASGTLIVAFVQRYVSNAGLGTVISTMMPFSVAFLIVWALLFSLFLAFDIPVGPGVQIHLR